MSFLPYLFGAVALIGALLWLRSQARRRWRARLLATPLTLEQRNVVGKLVPITRRLPAELRRPLEGKINLFLAQVTFHGRAGLEMNEAMRLSIAAQACLLIVNSPLWYETLRTILVYPGAFRTRRPVNEDQIVAERDFHMVGESWARGPVVLSWDDALQGGLDADDGYNVVIHEFAHQLDALTGHTNGIPVLRRRQAYERWERAILQAYEAHLGRVHSGMHTLIDPYGATNHEEFFAEAIVTFFEKPRALKAEEPELYRQVSQLLALDPASWA